jgi:Ribonuclease P/MRP, subunit p29
LKGIVVRDTKFTFVIVTSKDEVKSKFPSDGTLVILACLPSLVVC